MSWLLTLIIITFTFNNPSQAHKHEKKLQSAVVVGTVYCDTCFHQDFSKTSHFISGALVAIECNDTNSKPNFLKEVKTNERGEFKVNLPFSVSKHIKKIKGCSVKIISSSEPYCAVASTATSSSIHLKSRKPGTHIFSAGFFTFKPLKQPALCSQKPSTQISKEFNSMKPFLDDPSFPPPIQDPLMPFLPPLPQLPNLPPLPQLPIMPPLPGFPFPSKSSQLSNQKTFGIPFPPNPFQPPSILPPNPLQPPPSILPPVFPSPPSSIIPPILPPFVPIPGLTPPSPPPRSFPFLPPLPPGFPGIPPRATSSKETRP
ncbi:hypothetical protein LguiB_019579 [Lonicera macranthoides]